MPEALDSSVAQFDGEEGDGPMGSFRTNLKALMQVLIDQAPQLLGAVMGTDPYKGGIAVIAKIATFQEFDELRQEGDVNKLFDCALAPQGTPQDDKLKLIESAFDVLMEAQAYVNVAHDDDQDLTTDIALATERKLGGEWVLVLAVATGSELTDACRGWLAKSLAGMVAELFAYRAQYA